MKNVLLLILLSILVVSPVLAQVDYYCGDGICTTGETEANCEVDCRCVATVVDITPPAGKDIQTKEVSVPFFDRGASVDLDETCGYDGNLDGILCDPNEDWINCPEDCSAPSVDSLLCLGVDCLWQEAWFARILIILLVVIGIFLIRSRARKKRK